MTERKTFDYYPRGRVEIENGKITVYLCPQLCTDETKKQITGSFGLDGENVIFKSDGSEHYRPECGDK